MLIESQQTVLCSDTVNHSTVYVPSRRTCYILISTYNKAELARCERIAEYRVVEMDLFVSFYLSYDFTR